MRKYRQHFDGHEVNLDNPKIYSYLPKTTKELRNLMFKEIGYAIVYMDYFPSRKGIYPKKKLKDKFAPLSDWGVKGKKGKKMCEYNNSGWNQRQRIYKLIKKFAENERANYDNVKWYKEQVFLFQDETENMC